jgi:hypothetical protein
MNKKKEKTVGQLSHEASLLEKEPIRVQEQTAKMHEEYGEELMRAIQKGIETYPGEPIFFIEDITRQERLMMNVIRHTLIPRMSCPTPNYDQTVYRYSMKDDTLELVWVLPSPETCQYYLQNLPLVVDEERELMQFILDWRDGRLEKMAQDLNCEEYQLGMAFVKDTEQ